MTTPLGTPTTGPNVPGPAPGVLDAYVLADTSPTGVSRAMDGLALELDRLENIATRLGVRLGPVLSPTTTPARPEAPPVPVPAPPCDLAQAIAMRRDHVSTLADRLDDLLERLDV